jgi:hypothetical protein
MWFSLQAALRAFKFDPVKFSRRPWQIAATKVEI